MFPLSVGYADSSPKGGAKTVEPFHIPCRLRIRRQLTKLYRSPVRKAAKHTTTDRYAGSSAAAMLHRLSPPPPP